LGIVHIRVLTPGISTDLRTQLDQSGIRTTTAKLTCCARQTRKDTTQLCLIAQQLRGGMESTSLYPRQIGVSRASNAGFCCPFLAN
jgi:hypothetical protein